MQMAEPDEPTRHVLEHPANTGLVRHFALRCERVGMEPVLTPGNVRDPYYGLGTHPDLVSRLWDELASTLPIDCRAVFYGAPALIHPSTGIIFGFAGGTHTYALRLPGPERADAMSAGATRTKTYPCSPLFDLTELGDEWVFCGWFHGEQAWCLAAFREAGRP